MRSHTGQLNCSGCPPIIQYIIPREPSTFEKLRSGLQDFPRSILVIVHRCVLWTFEQIDVLLIGRMDIRISCSKVSPIAYHNALWFVFLTDCLISFLLTFLPPLLVIPSCSWSLSRPSFSLFSWSEILLLFACRNIIKHTSFWCLFIASRRSLCFYVPWYISVSLRYLIDVLSISNYYCFIVESGDGIFFGVSSVRIAYRFDLCRKWVWMRA